jgi:hypothetical protein
LGALFLNVTSLRACSCQLPLVPNHPQTCTQPNRTPGALNPARPLAEALSAVLPCVAALPLTLDSVNAGGWVPRKDHASGRLVRGALQLPPGALLLLDETQMGAGAIGERGVRGLQALARVLADQQLPVDFQFYQVWWGFVWEGSGSIGLASLGSTDSSQPNRPTHSPTHPTDRPTNPPKGRLPHRLFRHHRLPRPLPPPRRPPHRPARHSLG